MIIMSCVDSIFDVYQIMHIPKTCIMNLEMKDEHPLVTTKLKHNIIIQIPRVMLHFMDIIENIP